MDTRKQFAVFFIKNNFFLWANVKHLDKRFRFDVPHHTKRQMVKANNTIFTPSSDVLKGNGRIKFINLDEENKITKSNLSPTKKTRTISILPIRNPDTDIDLVNEPNLH